MLKQSAALREPRIETTAKMNISVKIFRISKKISISLFCKHVLGMHLHIYFSLYFYLKIGKMVTLFITPFILHHPHLPGTIPLIGHPSISLTLSHLFGIPPFLWHHPHFSGITPFIWHHPIYSEHYSHVELI